MRTVAGTQTAQYIIVIVAYMIPVVWLAVLGDHQLLARVHSPYGGHHREPPTVVAAGKVEMGREAPAAKTELDALHAARAAPFVQVADTHCRRI
jgi:hypothetical protein